MVFKDEQIIWKVRAGVKLPFAPEDPKDINEKNQAQPLKTETTSNIVTSTTTSNTTDNSMVESNMIPNNDISAVEDKSNLTDNPADLSEDIYYTLNNSSTDILNNDTNDDSSSDNDINKDDNSESDSVVTENKED